MTEQSQSPDAEPRDAEITDLTQHRRRAESGARLSAASAASVRDAAIVVLTRGVRYLPVVEDGTLVALVALAPAPQTVAPEPTAAHIPRALDSDWPEIAVTDVVSTPADGESGLYYAIHGLLSPSPRRI
jgi:hypothetical protein